MKDKIKAILLIIMAFSAEICHAGELWKVPITKAMAFHLQMKEDASVRAQKERGIKNQIKIWATCKETSERLQSQYYRLDAIRYNAQQIFEWQDTYPKETDMYKDAKDAESQWLFLMNQVSSRLGIARTECKKKWTTPAVELGRARTLPFYQRLDRTGVLYILWKYASYCALPDFYPQYSTSNGV
jgi:hypothetical protein